MATLPLISRRPFGRLAARVFVGLLLSGSLAACSLSDLVNDTELPPNQTDPAAVKTPEGAMAAYQGAILTFTNVLGGKFVACLSSCYPTYYADNDPSYMYTVGLLTDELSLVQTSSNAAGGFPTSGIASVDSRTVPDNDGSSNAVARNSFYEKLYGQLQSIRARSRDARGALLAYTADSTTALVGHLYALEGYADVLLAELYCSGIPLSTVTFNGDFTLTRGFTSDEVYQHAIALFDSALVLSADSANFVNFATMGRARAELGLGNYADAAQNAASVPTSYQYLLHYTADRVNFHMASPQSYLPYPVNESNREGGNGLAYYDDPRTDTVRSTAASPARFLPRRWLQDGASPANGWKNDGTKALPIATGVEARLIEAEAALHDGGDWLGILNGLRTDGTFSVSGTDTTWNAGTGGFANLAPLTDPGTDSGRVSLLFSERAHWLFLTGYRQGDLRRLVRQYHRAQEAVYPTGPWGSSAISPYGSDVNAAVPASEQKANPLYGGCVNRDA
jgi:hypothetical protein